LAGPAAKPGDTLQRIRCRCGVGRPLITETNRPEHPRPIFPGRKPVIPAG